MSAVVDAHLHVFAAQSDAYPRPVDDLFPPGREALVDDFVAEMEANGVAHAVLVPLSEHDDYVRDALARHPGRFAAIGVQDPATVPSAEEYRIRAEASGLQGIRLFTVGDPAVGDVEQLPAFPLLALLAERGHKLWSYCAPDEIELLGRIAERLPGLTIVLNHLGFSPSPSWVVDEHGRPRIETPLPPPTLPAILELARFAGVHVHFSGQYAFTAEPYPYDDLRPIARALAGAFGPERLLWASDWPWIAREPGYARLLALVDDHLAFLSDAERDAVRGGNALRLFRF